MSEAARVLLGHPTGYGTIAELTSDECRLLHDTVAERAGTISRMLPDLYGTTTHGLYVAKMDELHALAKRLLFARVWISEQVQR